MSGKITIQDIADALGVSRNTVSKAINNTGVLAESTREKVLQKAIEMGYKQFSYANSISEIHNPTITAAPSEPGEIALFTGNFLGNSHFASTMLDKFQHELSLLGYSMTIHRVTDNNFEEKSLPKSYISDHTKGIMCIEMFDYDYCEMICNLGLPVLMVDGPVDTYSKPLNADMLLMNNSANIFQMINDMKKRGLKKIGFLGKASHCRSFWERYIAYRNAMYLNGLEIDEKFDISMDSPKKMKYQKFLAQKLSELDEMPDLFICANDFIVMDALLSMKTLGITCPDDVKLFGFDDSQESQLITPSLSTCHIHSQVMGFSAANLLMTRINQPELNYRTLYAETDLIYRDSTK
jgi:LacI family transcriptional regulator